MNVRAISTRKVVTTDADATVLKMRALFKKGQFHHLLIVDNGDLIGVLSDRDVLAALSPFLDTPVESHRDIHTLSKPARTLIKRSPVTIEEDASIGEAASLLLEEGVSCLPVLDADGAVSGVLTSKDILRHTAAS